MYIRSKQLWWLLPIFIGLFLLGIALGSISDRPSSDPVSVVSVEERAEADREMIAAFLDQLSSDRDQAFTVNMKEHTLQGYFNGEKFQLSGTIGGHQLEMKRMGETVEVIIDGEGQDSPTLPYALYTPYEHAMLLKSHLHSLTPLVVTDHNQNDLLGFHLSLKPDEVTQLLALWLGPSFPVDRMTPTLAKQIEVDYQVWYDENSKQVKQLVVDLRMNTPAGLKQDQLLFRL
ncbi:hypothetical protein [Brevibacillus sp. H7]|uniref:hypothetical protein n=1 Tax=Brevibacillus sp. H7 TaxID=3349138 RepID=UPI0038096909